MVQLKIFLDMDGCIVDCHRGFLELHGVQDPYLDTKNHGNASLEQILCMTPKEFWSGAEYDFWKNLKPTEDAFAIYKLVEYYAGKNNIQILSKPNRHHGCKPGKRDWLKMYFPHLAENPLFEQRKADFASSDAVLIDDFDYNIDEFRKAGGNAILIKRLWNSGHKEAEHTLEYLEMELEQLFSSNIYGSPINT